MQLKVRLELCAYPHLPGFCWRWAGAKADGRYGSIGYNGRTWSTHRLAYTLLVGPVPADLQLDHLCRNILCCNPRHIEPVTAQENADRKPISQRCIHGHPLVGPNLRIKQRTNGKTQRECRYCAAVARTAKVNKTGRERKLIKAADRREAMLAASEATLRQLSAAAS